jgi:hypothetical protein
MRLFGIDQWPLRELQGMAPMDAAAGTATIVMRDALDPESAATAMRGVIQQLVVTQTLLDAGR